MFIFIIISCKKDNIVPINNVNNTQQADEPNPISLKISVQNDDFKLGGVITITSTCNLQSDSITFLEREFYLSKDKTKSVDDQKIYSNSFYYSGISAIYLNKGLNKMVEFFSLPTYNTIPEGNYYILVSMRIATTNYYSYSSEKKYSSYYSVTSNKSYSLYSPESKIKFSKISINPMQLYSGGSTTININYNSSLANDAQGNLSMYITTDTLNMSSKHFLSNSFQSITFKKSTGIETQKVNVPTISINSNENYYLFCTGTYVENGDEYTIKPKFIPVKIQPFINQFSISELNIGKSSVFPDAQISVSGIIKSESSEDISTYINYYLSSDSIYSNDDNSLSYSSTNLSIKQGTTIFSNTITPYSYSTKYGDYYIIAKTNISSNYGYSNNGYIEKSTKISFIEPLTTITQLALTSTSITNNSSLQFSLTSKSDVTKSTYKTYKVYLSSDTNWTLDDYFIEDESISFDLGTKISDYYSYSSRLPKGNFYLILRSSTSDGSALKQFISSNIVTIN